VPTRQNHLHGLLIVDKPGLDSQAASALLEQHRTGNGDPAAADSLHEFHLLTSHDVVQRVRRWGGQRRIGHTGTLDPAASGVLVLCLGAATRLVEYYQGHDKQYLAEVAFGFATETYDLLGRVTERAPAAFTRAALEDAVATLRGAGVQTPPVYSALKQGGESLHARARRGEAVEVQPRPVTFYAIEILEADPPERALLRVRCSAGAYIRSLADDLGRALGTRAVLAGLRREAAGAFTLAQAHTLPAIEAAAQEGTLEQLLLPPGAGLDLPALRLSADERRRLGYGQVIVPDAPPIPPRNAGGAGAGTAQQSPAAMLVGPGSLAQGLDETGRLAGILRCVDAGDGTNGAAWRAEKWLAG
jgi:tRNA pseudouridine55 synthase